MEEMNNISASEEAITMADRIYLQLREDIVSGVIPHGQKIVEASLAKQYKTSRGPLREALQRLEGVHIIERIPNAGSRVATIDLAKMEELYQVREGIEGFATRLATMAMSQEEIDGLYQLMANHEVLVEQTGGITYIQKEGNDDFHFYIFSKCQNQWLVNCITNNLYHLVRMCRLHTMKLTTTRAQLGLGEHIAIVEAIDNRDPELSEMLMRRHIRSAWKVVSELMTNSLPENR